MNLIRHTGNGIAGPQVQYLSKWSQKIRGTKTRQNEGFCNLVTLGVNKNGARSEVDGYCTCVYYSYSLAGTWKYIIMVIATRRCAA